MQVGGLDPGDPFHRVTVVSVGRTIGVLARAIGEALGLAESRQQRVRLLPAAGRDRGLSCARRAEDTDWVRIGALHDALAQVQPSPVVELNRGVAVGLAFGPGAGGVGSALTGPDTTYGRYWLPAHQSNWSRPEGGRVF
jgi:hypothetical protein